MKKIIISGLLAAVLMVPVSAHAMTQQERSVQLQSLINQLVVLLAQLQTQKTAITPVVTTSTVARGVTSPCAKYLGSESAYAQAVLRGECKYSSPEMTP